MKEVVVASAAVIVVVEVAAAVVVVLDLIVLHVKLVVVVVKVAAVATVEMLKLAPSSLQPIWVLTRNVKGPFSIADLKISFWPSSILVPKKEKEKEKLETENSTPQRCIVWNFCVRTSWKIQIISSGNCGKG